MQYLAPVKQPAASVPLGVEQAPLKKGPCFEQSRHCPSLALQGVVYSQPPLLPPLPMGHFTGTVGLASCQQNPGFPFPPLRICSTYGVHWMLEGESLAACRGLCDCEVGENTVSRAEFCSHREARKRNEKRGTPESNNQRWEERKMDLNLNNGGKKSCKMRQNLLNHCLT